MTRLRLALLCLLGLASLSGAGSLSAAAPPDGGTIAIVAKAADGGDGDAVMPAFVDAASAALTARGFLILDDPLHAAYVAELVVSRTAVGTALGKGSGGASVGIAGAGVVLPLGAGKSSLVPLVRTRLEIRMRKRGESAPAWQGAAMTVRESGQGKRSPQAIATDLSRALLDRYPAEIRDVIGVP